MAGPGRQGGAFGQLEYLTPPFHLFAQDRTSILDAMNQAVSRLHVYEDAEASDGGAQDEAA